MTVETERGLCQTFCRVNNVHVSSPTGMNAPIAYTIFGNVVVVSQAMFSLTWSEAFARQPAHSRAASGLLRGPLLVVPLSRADLDAVFFFGVGGGGHPMTILCTLFQWA